MCGLCGFSFGDRELLNKMADTLKKRAIDADNFYIEPFLSCYHAHLKMSDINADTSQPYIYEDKYIIGLVGEIYNKKELSALLKISYITEVNLIAKLYDKFGKQFVKYLNGEFFIFIYDRINSIYLLYRDRWGVKPVYYKISEGQLFFSSEIKSLVSFNDKKNKEYFVDHVIFSYSFSPKTILKDVYSLAPGTYLKFSSYLKQAKIYKYDNYVFFEKNDLITTIKNSIKRRLPNPNEIKYILIGLSGGPDSNLILYLVSKLFKGKVVAYSIQSNKNNKEIRIAQSNTHSLGIPHYIFDESEFNILYDLYDVEALVKFPIFWPKIKKKIAKDLNIDTKALRVELCGDGKEELFLYNQHYNYKTILSTYKFLKEKLKLNYKINQQFLNLTLFDYNLQFIEKATLQAGIERRLPFTDYEMLRYFKFNAHKYRHLVKDYLNTYGLDIVDGEYGLATGFPFRYVSLSDLKKMYNDLYYQLLNRAILH